MTTSFAIDVQNLVKKFGDKVAVNGVSIQMPYGQVWGFLGPNGSGKTTTIRMICGLLNTTSGEGTCLGYDIARESREIKVRTGYMTQKFSFWGDLTIRENLEFVARLYQLPKMKTKVDDTLENLGLSNRQHQVADALSGGWKQRLALAACLIHSPKLLLDEPTAGVDPQARRDFWDEIHRLSSNGMTVLVSTHYMDEAERCDRVAYLANGVMVTKGTVADIIARSGLVTFTAEGDQIRSMASQLRGQPGVDHIAYFGSALHVSGLHRDRLESTLKRSAQDGVQWHEVQPSLEDSFIALMNSSGEDTRAHS